MSSQYYAFAVVAIGQCTAPMNGILGNRVVSVWLFEAQPLADRPAAALIKPWMITVNRVFSLGSPHAQSLSE